MRRLYEQPFLFFLLTWSLFVFLFMRSSHAETPRELLAFGETLELSMPHRPNVKIHSVSRIHEDGKIDLQVLEKQNNEIVEKKIERKLTETSRREIFRMSERLSNITLDREELDFVCALQPPFGKSVFLGLWLQGEEGLQEILSPSECWTGYSLEPSNPEDFEATQELRDYVRALRNEILGL